MEEMVDANFNLYDNSISFTKKFIMEAEGHLHIVIYKYVLQFIKFIRTKLVV